MSHHPFSPRRLGVVTLSSLVAVTATTALSGLTTSALAADRSRPVHRTVAVAPADLRTSHPLSSSPGQEAPGEAPATAEHGVLYVADYSAGVVNKIDRDGTVSTIGSGFDSPMGVDTDATGSVYVADGGGNKVEKVAPDGTQTTLPFSGLEYPVGVAVDNNGNVFVGDNANHRVVELAPDGTQTTLPFEGLQCPNGLAVDADDNVYVTSFCTGQVFEMTPGGVQSTVGSGFNAPSGVDVDADGNVWVADAGLASVFEVAPDGTQTTVPFGDPQYPVGIAVDTLGNVFDTDFAEPASTRQRRPDGSVSTVAVGWGYDVAALDLRDIPFTSEAPTGSVPGDTYVVSAATEDSDAPISFEVGDGSGRQCTVTDNGDGTAEVELNRVGTCTIEATQPGDDETAPGRGTQSVTIRHRQNLAFTSTPQRPQVDGSYQVTATGGGSDNPVLFSLAEGSETGCSVTAGGLVTFAHATACTIAADQAGDDTHVAARTAYQQVSIARGTQVVTFTSVHARKGKIGKTYLPKVTGGASERPVRITASGACRARKGVVTFTHAGTCRVYANQTGNADYLPGKAHQTIRVDKRR
jgi:streptogramin lyase